ncbi:GNAT family protein [Streptomyces collinus]|uniref:GNAT family N-acetyltransferase n=1 Tax=Streptomyces collinus TaxID=42684 RepID=UPI0033AE6305
MIRGEKIGLRARHEDDIAVLQSELYDDVRTQALADSAPWRPVPPGSEKSPYAVGEKNDDIVFFSVVELASQKLAGEALLWGIDTYNRRCHLGLSLLPAFRGTGLGTDIVRALCTYGFAVRGLHRLQIETAADNAAMIRAAERAGFTREGTLRGSAWGYGAFSDEVVLGMLDHEWRDGGRPAR